jgi:subtilisin family serine protease
VSAWWTGSSDYNVLSGTSMATPFATGVAALYLGRNSTMTPADVIAAMINDGSLGVVQDPGTLSPNILLSTANLA